MSIDYDPHGKYRRDIEAVQARLASALAALDVKNAEIERLREGQDADRRLIAHLTRAIDALGCSPEDDPLDIAKARMQEIADGDAALDEAREALEIIAGKRPCLDNLMGNVDIARAALARIDSLNKGERK